MIGYGGNFHIYKETGLRLNDFMQHLNLNFHLALINAENSASNTLAEYDHNNPINRKGYMTFRSRHFGPAVSLPPLRFGVCFGPIPFRSRCRFGKFSELLSKYVQ